MAAKRVASMAELDNLAAMIANLKFRDALDRLERFLPCPRSSYMKAQACCLGRKAGDKTYFMCLVSTAEAIKIFHIAVKLNPGNRWLLETRVQLLADDLCIVDHYLAVQDALAAGCDVDEQAVSYLLSNRCLVNIGSRLTDFARLPELTAHLHYLNIIDTTNNTPVPAELTTILRGTRKIDHLMVAVNGQDIFDSVWHMDWLVVLIIARSTYISCEAMLGRLGKLTCLTSLIIRTCPNLTSLPDEIRALGALQRLTVENCCDFMSLPDSITELTALQILVVMDCAKLTRLPENIGAMRLTALELTRLGLRKLPLSISMLTGLLVFTLTGCNELTCVPMRMCDVQTLRGITVRDCRGIKIWWRTMMASIGQKPGPCILTDMQRQYPLPPVLVLVLGARRRRIRHLPDELWQMVIKFLLFGDL